MKTKFCLSLLMVFIFALCVNSETYTLKNKNISIDLNLENKNIYISQIKDVSTNTEFIKNVSDSSLWSFTIKKNEDFQGDEIKLFPFDASSMEINYTNTNVKIVWKNVKTKEMAEGFDVTVKGNLIGENSYWDLNISKNSHYGVWNVSFPNIGGIDVTNGNEFYYPICGGILDKNFENGTFQQPYPYYGCAMQFCSLTKGNSSLYLCPEDLKCKYKIYKCTAKNGSMIFNLTNIPANMAIGDKEYKQEYKFNIATIKGDNYNVCKKYRKWGIDHKFNPFSKGTIASRSDLPDWWKKNNVWMSANVDSSINWALKVLYDIEVPAIIHMYQWSKNVYDTHYPNMLPQKDNVLGDMEKFRKAKAKIMPYTNGRLVDRNQSDYYKIYGDNILIKNEKGGVNRSGFQSAGTDNVESCIGSPYFDCYFKEATDIMKTINYDVLYVDQLGTIPPMPCFAQEHNHPMGCGEYWVKNYNKLLEKTRKEINKMKGEGVPITTECSAEAFAVDAYLAFAEWAQVLAATDSQMYVYSGYINKFGTMYEEKDFTTQNSLPAINKTAVALCKGYQLGWRVGYIYRNPDPFGKHFKNAAKAREAAWEYFNMGEMVRPVKFLTEIPKKNIFWQFLTEEGYYDFPSVRTCSFNYKGKTMVCFASVEPEKDLTFTWTANAKDINLKNKKSYTISEIYPQKQVISKGKIETTTTLSPLDIKIFVIE